MADDIMALGFQLEQIQSLKRGLADVGKSAGVIADNTDKANAAAAKLAATYNSVAQSVNGIKGNNFRVSSSNGPVARAGRSMGGINAYGGAGNRNYGPFPAPPRQIRTGMNPYGGVANAVYGPNPPSPRNLKPGINYYGGVYGQYGPQPAPAPKGFDWSKINQAIRSTRVGSGNGAMPLIGRTADALGLEGLTSGPVGLAISGIVAAGTAAWNLAKAGAAASNAFAADRQTSGGTNAETGMLRSLGNAGGLNLADLSRQVHENITTSPTAMAEAQKYGVHDVGGAYGTRDYATSTLKLIDAIRKNTNQQEKQLSLRRLGLESAEILTRISDSQYALLKGDAQITDMLNTPEKLKQSADFDAALGRVKTAAENYATGEKTNPVFTAIANFFARGINNMTKQDQAVVDHFSGKDSTKPGDSHTEAVKENTDEVTKMRQAMENLTNAGTPFGGGARANGGIPGAYRSVGGGGYGGGAHLRAAMIGGNIGFDSL